MGQITAIDIPKEGLKLTHKVLMNLSDDFRARAYKICVARLLDELDGSKVEVFLIIDNDGGKNLDMIQLRCGKYRSISISPNHTDLDGFILLAPFIAEIAGKSDDPTPSDWEKLNQRLDSIEQRVGVQPKSETTYEFSIPEDPYWYEKSYINGYYGDLWVKHGGRRDDYEGFGRWLSRFGMDLH